MVLGGDGVGTETGRSDERSCRGQAENAVLSETQESAAHYGSGGGDLVYGNPGAGGVFAGI